MKSNLSPLRAVTACGAVLMAVVLTACGGGGGVETASTAPAALQNMASAMAQSARMPVPRAAAAITSGAATEDFENGMADWSNWGNAQVVANIGVNGSHAMQVGTAAGGAGLTVPGVVAGTAYRLTAQVQVTDPSETLYVGVNMDDANGNAISQQSVPMTSTSYAPATVDITAPVGAVDAVVYVWKNAGVGYGVIDNVDFGTAATVAVPPPPPPPPPPTAGTNLLLNGGFENGLTRWDNWGHSTTSTTQANTGTAALQVGTAAGGVGQSVSVSTTGTYSLTAQVKVSDPSEVAYIGVNMRDANGATLNQQSIPASSINYSTASFNVDAPAGTAKAQVYVWKNAGVGYAYVDDVSLAYGALPPPPPIPAGTNLVQNPGFENGLASWNNWGNATAVTGQASTGTYALAVGAAAGGAGQIINNVTPGTTYQLIATVKAGGTEVGSLGVSFLDANGNNLQSQAVAFSGTAFSTAMLNVLAPPNTASALVYVWKSAGTDDVYVDDVSFAALPSSGTGRKLTVIGNSITYSAPTPTIGWDHTSGMAASSASTDFAHLVAAADGVLTPDISNFSALERDPTNNISVIPNYTSLVDSNTDVVIELGDNVTSANLAAFTPAYNQLLDSVVAHKGRSLTCVGTWWVDTATDSAIQSACTAHGGKFVYIGDVRPDPNNQDHLVGPQYTDPSVNDHPHDWSMNVIANRIIAAIP